MQEIKIDPKDIHPKTLVICREAPSQVTAEDAIDLFGAREVWMPIGLSSYLSDLRYAQVVEKDGRLVNKKMPYTIKAGMGLVEVEGGRIVDDDYMFKNWYRLAGHLAGDVLLYDLSTAGDHKPFEIVYPLITEGEDFYIKDGKIFYPWEDGKAVARGSGDIVDFDDSFAYCQLLANDGYYHLCK